MQCREELGLEYVRRVWPNAQTKYIEALEKDYTVIDAVNYALEGISYNPSDVGIEL